jgi:hypothetical protein
MVSTAEASFQRAKKAGENFSPANALRLRMDLQKNAVSVVRETLLLNVALLR